MAWAGSVAAARVAATAGSGDAGRARRRALPGVSMGKLDIDCAASMRIIRLVDRSTKVAHAAAGRTHATIRDDLYRQLRRRMQWRRRPARSPEGLSQPLGRGPGGVPLLLAALRPSVEEGARRGSRRRGAGDAGEALSGVAEAAPTTPESTTGTATAGTATAATP